MSESSTVGSSRSRPAELDEGDATIVYFQNNAVGRRNVVCAFRFPHARSEVSAVPVKISHVSEKYHMTPS